MLNRTETEQLTDLVKTVIFQGENERVEFKHNNKDPKEIGQYISALANSAALEGKNEAYIIWGIEDHSNKIVGTSFIPEATRIENEVLENWLHRLLEPKLDIYFNNFSYQGSSLVLLKIVCLQSRPVSFEGIDYIRIGSVKKKLKDCPEKQRALWRSFDKRPFEQAIVASDIDANEILSLLDYSVYFELRKRPLPSGQTGIIEALQHERLIIPSLTGRWDITNLAAILLAKKIENFPTLQKKALRVIFYKDNDRITTVKEKIITLGYANGFSELMNYLDGLLPRNEIIGQALREEVPVYPNLVILFSPKELNKMDREERIRACYQHACLRYVKHEFLTNASLRERFKIDEKNSPLASRYIREAVQTKVIKPASEGAAPKAMKYAPYWYSG